MSKTVNTLNIGDKAYRPKIEEIIEITINKIEKTDSGIKVGLANFCQSFNYSKYNAAISTIIQFESGGPYPLLYLRIEDAQAEQRRLQITELKRLQGAAHNSLRVLNEFTLKYFTDENIK